jgi:SHS2 domain-containing protein
MIKIFTKSHRDVEELVNNWLEENHSKIEVNKITQSTCFDKYDGVQVTIMIEYQVFGLVI